MEFFILWDIKEERFVKSWKDGKPNVYLTHDNAKRARAQFYSPEYTTDHDLYMKWNELSVDEREQWRQDRCDILKFHASSGVAVVE